MKVAIMQPYFLPYIGYFQLINAVDEFIIYDNIQYTKKGWINRNRILMNDHDALITLPVKKDSDFLNVVDRKLSDDWHTERNHLLNRIRESYRKAACFPQVYPVIERILLSGEANLFRFILNSLTEILNHLGIETPVIISSGIPIDHGLKSAEKVIALCRERKAATYINPAGGVELYDKASFRKEGIDLLFLKTGDVTYRQFNNAFVPNLSILDVMMFNEPAHIRQDLLTRYTLS
jgi:hypothetical protein